jgi:glutamate---cysteine ligase / carboxylate-amine ligase
VRYGLDGMLLDLGKEKEVPTRDLILELLDFVDEVVDELDSRKEIEHIHTILERGTSADEQLRVYEENGQKFEPVVDMLIKNTMENVPTKCFD